MEDAIQAIGAGSGYALLALAFVVFWRLYRAVEKDRDFWREQALKSTVLADVGSKTAAALAEPTSEEDDRRNRLVAAARVLTHELEEAVKG